MNTSLHNPYAEQFDLAVQQELGLNTVLSVSYLGALSRELPNYLNVNLNPASTYLVNYTVAPGTNGSCGVAACGTVIPVKVYANRIQTGPATGTYTYAPLQNSSYNAITEFLSNINANYHAITVETQRRQSRFLSFDANYTWSHALDFNQNQQTMPGTNNWFDPFGNTRANYGNSSYNVPHRLVAWALLNFPGSHGGGYLRFLSNGWSIKPLLQVQSGLPYSVNTSGNAPNQCYFTVGCLESAGGGLAGTGVSYIPFFGRNSLRQPATAVVDARVEKDFKINEKYDFQLIGEGFNLANHANVTGVNTTGYAITTSQGSATVAPSATLVYQPTFQAITTENSNYAYNTRLIQIAARFVF